MTTPRVRFAPSPTGYLHVGGARTALFNWLFARHTGGTLVLRIEDTDRERSTEAHTRVILDGLGWLGISCDEGPFFQGAYGDRHRADAERLLAEGKAYRCFCTREELEAQRARAEAAGQTFRYDGRCGRLTPDEVAARIAAGDPSTIRFRVPDEELAWDDAVHGRISFQGHDLDDFVILRSDDTAIYNMAGLTHQGDLDSFWKNPTPPEMDLMADFRRVVLHRTQVNGGFFSKEAIDRAVAGSVPRMEAALPDAMLVAARAVSEVAERDGELAPVY